MSKIDTARAAWAVRIVGAWRKSVEAFLEAGRLLTEAKVALPHGAFLEMVERDLPFKRSTAFRLMAIAADPRLADVAHVHHLPPHWGTLYELTKLSDEQFGEKLSTGEIHPEMERRDVVMAEKRERRAEREAGLGAIQAALPQKRYGVIYPDPPWRYEVYSEDTGQGRTAESHYSTMTPEALRALDVASIAADDCVLFMWTTAPHLPEALDLLKAWGFEYRSQCIWAKDKIGLGFWFRNQHEILLVAVKGKIPAPAHGTQWPSLIQAPRGKHSEKPVVFYELIEAYFPNLPKIELFARSARPGWDCWGAEAPAEAAE